MMLFVQSRTRPASRRKEIHMRLPAAILMTLACLPAQAAELQMLCTGATRAVVETLVRQFETASGHKVVLASDTAGGATRRVEAGEHYDVVVIVPAAIDALIAKGKLAPGSRADIASVGIGVGVRENDPVPDISTVESFTAALRAARAIAYVDPAGGGTSGIYFRNWLERTGLAAEMAPKTKVQAGGYVAEIVARGEADIVVHQISEILPVKGVRMIGPLPAAIQLVTVYSAGLSTSPREPAAARALLAHLSSPAAVSVLKAAGMDTPSR
jgi:molybdate transport system substrate-binding protein